MLESRPVCEREHIIVSKDVQSFARRVEVHPSQRSSIQPHPPLHSSDNPTKPLVVIVGSSAVQHNGEMSTDHGLLGPAVDFTLIVAGCLAIAAPRVAIAERSVGFCLPYFHLWYHHQITPALCRSLRSSCPPVTSVADRKCLVVSAMSTSKFASSFAPYVRSISPSGFEASLNDHPDIDSTTR